MRWLLRAVVAVVVLVGVVAGGVAWRLSRGPIPLDLLVPRVRAALSGDGVRVDLGGLSLVWDPEHRHLVLHANGFRMTRADGQVLAFEAVTLRLQKRALLRGAVVVTAIEIFAPRVDLVLGAGGDVVLQSAAGLRFADADAIASRVTYVAIRDGRLTLVDEASGARWDVSGTDAWIWREGPRIRAQLAAALVAGDDRLPVWAETVRRTDGAFELVATSPGAPTGMALGAWPAAAAPEARAWVLRHLTGGRVRDLQLRLDGRASQDTLALGTIDATVGFDGLAVRFLDTMMPVTAMRGRGHFTRDGADFTVDAGVLDALAVRSSTVVLGWPAGKPPHVAIDARADGSLASALRVLDDPPVALGGALGVPTAGIAGTTRAHVRLAFALDGSARPGRLGLDAGATLAGVAVPNVMGDWAVGDGRAKVHVDDRHVSLEGEAIVADVPAKISAEQRFGDRAAGRLELSGRVDEAARARLGFDASALRGPVDAIVRVSVGSDGRPTADVEADLAPAELDVPALALRKPVGEPGRIAARLTLARGVITAVDRAELVVGETVVRASAARPPSGGTWSRVDAEATFPPPPDVVAAPGSFALALRTEGDLWRATVTSADVGAVLQAHGRDQVRGGRLDFDGTVDPRSAAMPWRGRVTVDRVTLRRMPWLVRLIGLASVHGLFGRDGGDSVTIDRLVATLEAPSSTIEIEDLVAKGPTLGLSLRGRVDRSTESLDLEGTLAPSYYMLNQGAGRIPILGEMFARASGGAVQAVAFTVRGTLAEPAVAVQPLASLAPGVLRDWVRKLGW